MATFRNLKTKTSTGVNNYKLETNMTDKLLQSETTSASKGSGIATLWHPLVATSVRAD